MSAWHQSVAYEQPQLAEFGRPRARGTDPISSHLAASEISPGSEDLAAAIRRVVFAYGPLTAPEIVEYVQKQFPGRWLAATITTGCAPRRSGLTQFTGTVKKIKRGECVDVKRTYYFCETEPVETAGRL